MYLLLHFVTTQRLMWQLFDLMTQCVIQQYCRCVQQASKNQDFPDECLKGGILLMQRSIEQYPGKSNQALVHEEICFSEILWL